MEDDTTPISKRTPAEPADAADSRLHTQAAQGTQTQGMQAQMQRTQATQRSQAQQDSLGLQGSQGPLGSLAQDSSQQSQTQTKAQQQAGTSRPQKTLTFVVPSFNMSAYLTRCVDSLVSSGSSDVEVLIIDDGSSDETPALADSLEAQHPGVVRAIHQRNKGHGGAVNTGIREAAGTYIKVVDADDWVGADSLVQLLEVLRGQVRGGESVDMVVTNYVYDKAGKRNKHVVRFRHVMKPDTILNWDDLRHFGIAQYLIMHTLTFRTEVLREARTELPEHTFYVDFIYAYQPLPWVRTLMYLDTPLYHYFIGREGQSVQTDVMVKRVDQLVRVNHLMSEATPEPGTVPRGLYRYMIHFLSINSVVTSVFLILSRNPANYQVKRALWQGMKRESPAIARDVRRQLPSRAINLPGATGRWLIRCGYHVANDFIGFN